MLKKMPVIITQISSLLTWFYWSVIKKIGLSNDSQITAVTPPLSQNSRVETYKYIFAVTQYSTAFQLQSTSYTKIKNKFKKSHSTRIYHDHRETKPLHPIQTPLGRVQVLRDVITQIRFEVDQLRIVNLARGRSYPF